MFANAWAKDNFEITKFIYSHGFMTKEIKAQISQDLFKIFLFFIR